MKVRVLPDVVINQISAGEVVERPASVVRELVDNSVDAGATEISVELEQGGQSLIKVSDDGCGMERPDALLAFERHATSKILKAEDLDAIATMGFRGEALASIASVSKVLLRSRTADYPVGTEIVMSGGVLKGSSEVAHPPGTTIEVRALFFNTPARKKFLRSPKTEAQKIKQWILHSSLAHPEIRYRLTVDGAEILLLPRASSGIERARSLVKGNAVPVRYPGERIQLEGIVGHPSLAQGDSGSFVVLVNSRVVSDRMVQKAVREGFDSTLKDREYPVGYLHIMMPPEDVDVNVHPQKAEVRFRDSQAIFKVVREAVLKSVVEFRAPMAGSAVRTQFPERSAHGSFSPAGFTATGGSSAHQQSLHMPLVHSSEAVPQSLLNHGLSNLGGKTFRFSDLELVGQVLECYLVGEFADELYLVDMHAAHERYNYNLIRNSFRNRALQSQQLLMPEVVTLSEEGLSNCLKEEEMLSRFGFAIEQFGEQELLIRAIPAVLKTGAAREVMKEIAAVVCEGTGAGRIEERLDHISARMACHASVRSGDMLKREEARALFAALDSTEFSAACPHGRPVVVSFPRAAVERWFGRDR